LSAAWQPAGPAEAADAPLPPLFYVVSTRKFAILFLATVGLYPIYWFYKNWDRYKDRVPEASRFGTTVSPVVRAAFSVFFVHTLFRRIREHGIAHAACRDWASRLHATWLVVLLLAGECVDTIVDALLGRPYGDLASFIVLALTLFAFLKAQRMINLACGDPSGVGNARLSRANVAWVVAGALGWLWTIGELVFGLHVVAK
jgi:hypothetical protein